MRRNGIYVSSTSSVMALALVLSTQAGVLQAQIIADPGAPSGQRPTILTAPNGTPLVNIQTPSASGISRNTYSQFDVQSNGAILNNATTNAQTQLGGWVQGNPWLANGSARAILNEVNSSNPSLLRGYVEVAGQRADVIISNPSGLQINGAGFINAGRVTLTTGSPNFNAGNLTGFTVQRGDLQINGAGLDASSTEYTELLARAVQVNAGIWAQQLHIVAGANQINVDLDNASNTSGITSTSPVAGTGTVPSFAIDVAQLGGMYVGKIILVGTEAGVGVRNAGYIGASAGDVIVTANGHLENSGTLYAQANTRLNLTEALSNSGVIAAQGNTTLSAASVNSSSASVLAAGLQSDGNLVANPGSSGNLQVTASGALAAHGQNLAAGNQSLSAQNLNLSGSATAAQTLTLNSATSLNTDSALVSAQQFVMNTASWSNVGGEVTQTGSGDLAVSLSGALDNRLGRIASNSQNFGLSSGDTLTNTGGTLEHAGTGTLQINSAAFHNDAGVVTSAGHLSLNTSQHALNNTQGQIMSSGALEVNSGSLNNSAGFIGSHTALSISADSIDNRNTSASHQGLAGNAVSVTTPNLNNTQGAVRANTTLTITSTGSVNNSQGLISSGHTLTVQDNQSTKTLVITNTGGRFIAEQQLTLNAASLSGDGQVLSRGDLNAHLSSDYTHTSVGEFQATGDASLSTSGTLTNQKKLLAGGTLNLQAAYVDNQAGAEISASSTTVNASNSLTNRGLIDGADTTLNAPTVNNLSSARLYGDHVAIAATTLNNLAENGSAPVIAARDRLDLGVGSLNNREHALIFSAGNLSIGGSLDANQHATGQASTLNNASATLEALGNLSLNVGSLNNTNLNFQTQPVLISTQSLEEYQLAPGDVYRPSDIVNRYTAAQKTLFNCQALCMQINATGDTSDQFKRYDYTRSVTATQTTQSDPAQILAAGNLSLAGGSVFNDNSHLIAGGALNASLASLTNTQTAGEIRTQDNGAVDLYLRVRRSGSDTYRIQTTAYQPADSVQSQEIGSTRYDAYTAPLGSGTTLTALSTTRVTASLTPVTQVPGPTPGSIIRSGGLNTTVPSNSLFSINRANNTQPLIETDPRFTNYRSWLSSDYLLTALGLDPATTQKRFADGFYEQRLIREQVAQLTGQRFLDGYADDEAQYAALMNAGATFALAYNLRPGLELSPAQMAQLTSDIVLLVERDIALADGSSTRVLAPQLYVRVQDGDLSGDGTLMAGNSVNLNVSGLNFSGDLTNQGTIAGRTLVDLNADTLNNLGGRIQAHNVNVRTTQDLNNIGGRLQAHDSLSAVAGRDLNLTSTVSTQTGSAANAQAGNPNQRTNLNRVAGLYVTGNNNGSSGNETLIASAGRDLNASAAVISNHSGNTATHGQTTGPTVLAAGRDLSLKTLTESQSQALTWDAQNTRREASQTEVGSTVQTTGNLSLLAGRDLSARAARVSSDTGALTAQAGRDLSLNAGQNRQTADESHQMTSKGFLSKSTLTTAQSLDLTQAQGSTFSGATATLHSGRDLTVTGSAVVSSSDTTPSSTTLAAGRDLTIQAATDTITQSQFYDTKKSGLLSSGGIGFTVGRRQQSTDQQNTSTTAVASTVGSVGGDVNLFAGVNYKQIGSDVLAPGQGSTSSGDLSIAAQNLRIQEARETDRSDTKIQFKQSGLTLAVTSPVISAVQTAEQMRQAARDTLDPRMKALAAANTGFAGLNAYNAVQAGQAQPGASAAEQAGGVNLSLSLGSNQSRSNTTQTRDSARGSSVQAGGDINLSATANNNGNNNANAQNSLPLAQRDLTVQGSRLSAGRNISLSADDEIQLLAARNTASQHSTNKSSSGSIGVSIGTDGLMLNLAASGARGKADGDDVTWTNTQVQAGERLTLNSGGDTTLRGAVAKGEQIIVNVGTNPNNATPGNLIIESLQDTSQFDSKQQSLGGSLSVGYGKASGSLSASQSKINSSYASVTEQSGLKAGDGGFQVSVANQTQLTGAVIASSDKAVQDGLNRLTTGTLTTSDLRNRAEVSANSSGINLSSDMATQGKYGASKAIVGNALSTSKESQGSSGSTRSAVSAGVVEITNEVSQQALTSQDAAQTIASLNRDTAGAQTAARRLDVQAVQRTAEAELAIKQETIKQVTVLTDEAYRSRFQTKPTLLKGTCPSGTDCDKNPSKIVYARANPEELAQSGGGTVLAVNGIFNDEKRAVELAYQNLVPSKDEGKPSSFFVMHIAPADNAISELLAVAYEKITASADYGLANFLGYTNGQELYADLLRSRGAQATLSLGHSRGTLVQEAAFTILSNRPDSEGNLHTNSSLSVRGVGGATNAQAYTEKAVQVTGEKNKDNISFNYFRNDPVSVIPGNNTGVTTVGDLWDVFARNNSMHSCYGTGAAGCTQVEIPMPGLHTGTPEGNARLIQFKGGVQVDAQGQPIQPKTLEAQP